MKSIVLTGGGTAGHVTPHFALLDLLKKHFDAIYYIGSTGGIEEKLVKQKGINYYQIPCVKLVRNSISKNLTMPFKFISSINQAKEILKDLKPSVVFSKGGYVGLPVTISASKLKIPVIVHESDLTLGLANKIASKFAKNVLTSFEETAKTVNNGLYVGTPIRKELFEITKQTALSHFNFNSDKPVLLITGGSLGAKAINTAIIDALPNLLKDYYVLHVVGKGNLTNFSHPSYRQIEFADMKYCYSACDLAISRAGANTAFELLALKKPTLFIPLPKGNSRGDQVDNANYFKNKNLAKVLLQENLNKTTLLNAVNNLKTDKNCLIDNMNKCKFVNANEKIVGILSKT